MLIKHTGYLQLAYGIERKKINSLLGNKQQNLKNDYTKILEQGKMHRLQLAHFVFTGSLI